MSWIHLVLLVVLDLAGVFFNLRMLWRCFKEKTKNSFVRTCRTLAIWQFACQVIIAVADAVESWKGFDIQPKEVCNVFRALSMSMMLFQACNITVIMILYNDHHKENRNQEASSKLKISIAMSLGFIGSSMIWWYCFSQEFLAHVFATVSCVATVVFVVYLFALASRNNIPAQPEETTPEAPMNTCHSLWKVCKEDKKQLSFIFLLLTCLVMIVSGVPRSSFNFHEILYLLMTRFTVGIVLPLTVSDLIDSTYEQENSKKVVVI